MSLAGNVLSVPLGGEEILIMMGWSTQSRRRPQKRSDSPSSARCAPDRGPRVARTWQPSLAPQRYELAALW